MFRDDLDFPWHWKLEILQNSRNHSIYITSVAQWACLNITHYIISPSIIYTWKQRKLQKGSEGSCSCSCWRPTTKPHPPAANASVTIQRLSKVLLPWQTPPSLFCWAGRDWSGTQSSQTGHCRGTWPLSPVPSRPAREGETKNSCFSFNAYDQRTVLTKTDMTV